MMIVGSIVAASLLPVGIVVDWDQWLAPGAIGWAAVILLALSVAVVGCLTLRFELTGLPNAAPAGNPAMTSLFHAERQSRVVPEAGRSDSQTMHHAKMRRRQDDGE